MAPTKSFPVILLTATLAISSCAKKAPNTGLHATITMRDGTQYSGTVTSTSPDQIAVLGE